MNKEAAAMLNQIPYIHEQYQKLDKLKELRSEIKMMMNDQLSEEGMRELQKKDLVAKLDSIEIFQSLDAEYQRFASQSLDHIEDRALVQRWSLLSEGRRSALRDLSQHTFG